MPGVRATIDATGQLVVPKPLRDELGLSAGTELELTVVDGRLEASVPSRVTVDHGPHGPRFVADTSATLTAAQIREPLERGRR